MKKALVLLTVLISLTTIISWCSDTNKVQTGDRVSITYTATLPDWTIFKEALWEDTVDFIVWENEVIKWLDEWVIWMKINWTKTLKISPENAYWDEYSDMNVQKVSKSIFDEINIEPKLWETQKLWDMEWVIKWFETDKDWYKFVLFDLNPAYTTQILTYKIKIEDLVKTTTPTE